MAGYDDADLAAAVAAVRLGYGVTGAVSSRRTPDEVIVH
jgi:hypothetical protein